MAVHTGHMAIGDDRVKMAFLPHGKGLLPIAGLADPMAKHRQLAFEQHQVGGVVIHYQNGLRWHAAAWRLWRDVELG
ncbi:hypothetical protein D3C76_1729810 [compost metagenome]